MPIFKPKSERMLLAEELYEKFMLSYNIRENYPPEVEFKKAKSFVRRRVLEDGSGIDQFILE